MKNIIPSHFGDRQPNRPGPNHPQSHPQAVPVGSMAAPIAIYGERSDFHIEQHQKKIQRYPFDCGLDLFPNSIQSMREVNGVWIFKVSTLFHILFPDGIYGRLVARSSALDKLKGAMVADGTIDSGFTGELLIRVISRTESTASLIEQCCAEQVALAQLILTPYVKILAVSKMPDMPLQKTGRCDAGFGSTDTPKPKE